MTDINTCSGTSCRPNYVDFPNCTCPQGFREEISLIQGEPKVCSPIKFIPSTDPEDFLQNAALTFVVESVSSSSQGQEKTFRLKFSDPPVLLLSPYTFGDLDSLITVEIKGYEKPSDYTQTLLLNSKGSIEIKIKSIASFNPTSLTVRFEDASKVRTSKGKILSNDQASANFPGSSNNLGFLSLEGLRSAAKVTSVMGSVAVAASTSVLSLSSMFGLVLGMIGKFFQVIEFTGLIGFFNIRFDELLDAMLVLVQNIADIDLFDFPFESSMKARLENSVASKWRGKFSKMDKPAWHLMDLGIQGLYFSLVYIVYAVFIFGRIQNKWRDRLHILTVSLVQTNIMDQIPLVVSTLGSASF